jgi:hypothetical protein
MSWRRLSGLVAAMVLLSFLSGCASVSKWFSKDDATTPQDAPVPTVPVPARQTRTSRPSWLQ